MRLHIEFEKIVFYLLGLAIALCIYWALNQNIEITLKPHVFAMQFLYQMQFEFRPDLGYREVHGLFIIGKDCIGAKLFVCMFFILNICCLNSYKGWLKKIVILFGFCIESVFLSFVVTVIRIAASIPFCEMPNFKLIHTILSLVIYFGSGLGLYAFLNYGLKHKGGVDIEYK